MSDNQNKTPENTMKPEPGDQNTASAVPQSADNAASAESEGGAAALAANFFITFFIALFAVVAILFAGLKLFGVGIYYIKTGSMEPAYPVNAVVFSKNVDPASIKVGDVITYAISEKDYVTHRVTAVKAEEKTFITKGDNNNVEDAPVLWGNVRGKVVFALRYGGNVISFITAEEHRTLFIIIIAVLLIGTAVWDVIERARKKRRKKAK